MRRILSADIVVGIAGLLAVSLSAVASATNGSVFSSREEKIDFAREVSDIIESSWIKWQDGIRIENVRVDGGYGRILPGGLTGDVFNASGIFRNRDTKGFSRYQVECMKVVAEAVADAMRAWQREYYHYNVPFPEGASSSFSLTPTTNVPVTVSSGNSPGKRRICESALQDFMLYRSPAQGDDESVSEIFLAAAEAFCAVFSEWERRCYVEDITASGGVAPAPAPMGMGPGPVRGAGGGGGRLTGAYLPGREMYTRMLQALDIDIAQDQEYSNR